jgi:DNA modification methylase
MHGELDKVWAEINKVVVPGGIVCINIGDATRTINSNFSLYSNHARIISAFLKLGFINLPNIIWRKQTNAPNKFMGSGMLPPGAYVTLEHEWILIFRKGGKRLFASETDKQTRRESAFFWEERNVWFSDVWNFKGVKQLTLNSITRERTAAYPFDLPYRLINMFSVKGDTVLDPFLGTGTTTVAAVATGRHSIGVDIDDAFCAIAKDCVQNINIEEINKLVDNRLSDHAAFITSEKLKGKEFKHFNESLKTPVVTSQEVGMQLPYLNSVSLVNDFSFEASYRRPEPVIVASENERFMREQPLIVL